MITSSREEDFTTKQEGNTVDIGKNSNKSSTCTLTSWSRLKDPRIVRVSRAFGGKDRHSKVCTVRGLRDRRVRLSVPTAIQLYDLQDRLGLNQPSKVVDWLLNVAKDEIDELPPLQIPPGNFSQIHQPFQANLEIGTSQSEKEGLKMNNSMNWEEQLGLNRSDFWNKSKEVETEAAAEKENWNQRNEEEKQVGANNVSASNFFPRPNNHSSIPGLLNNVAPYNSSFYRWDVPNSSFSLSHIEDHHQNFNVVPLPTGSQVLVCPPGTAQVPYFPSQVATSVEFNPKQINHFQMLNSSTTSQNPLPNSLSPSLYSLGQSTRVPLHLSMASKQFFPSHDSTSGSQSNNNEDFHPK